ncbi:hypothetical protein BdWA1_002640 [Babesia duncani]|uniref:Uncharacterized protein n=1 Tax=Babesia duncani TaxID=323732 RepID=A0AAD9PJL9_9APIC|nr:hypothetical protein BdWA1_002640 [Babesia duncani]
MDFDSPIIETRKKPKISKPEIDESHLLILNNEINADISGYKVIELPSPTCATEKQMYIAYNNKVYWLQGIKPNMNPVTMFVSDVLVNWEHILATFEFDVVFIFLTILYIEPNVPISMQSRIRKCYRMHNNNKLDLEKAVLNIWDRNVNDIVNRMEYLCDTEKSQSNELQYKPNNKNIKAMLSYKVTQMVKCAKNNCILSAGYCDEEEVSVNSHDHTVKHSIHLDEDKCKKYCWGLIMSYLSDATASSIFSPEFIKSVTAHATVEKRPAPAKPSHTNIKSNKKSTTETTGSILNYFARNASSQKSQK